MEVFISFGDIWYFMVRPKKEGPLYEKKSVSIDPELYKWVKSKIKIKRFSSLSHAVNEALLKLKNDIEKN
jgi:hypothetical protein